MKAPGTGREIPDPPKDPRERHEWKVRYYADLYGTPPSKLEDLLLSLPVPEVRRPPQWLHPIARIGWAIAILALIVWLYDQLPK